MFNFSTWRCHGTQNDVLMISMLAPESVILHTMKLITKIHIVRRAIGTHITQYTRITQNALSVRFEFSASRSHVSLLVVRPNLNTLSFNENYTRSGCYFVDTIFDLCRRDQREEERRALAIARLGNHDNCKDRDTKVVVDDI